MVYIDELLVAGIGDFGKRFQSILSMIPGGNEWLTWALADKNIPDIIANDENQLLNTIQIGLYENEYVLFNTFRVNIRKLFTMSDENIEQLAAIRKTVNDNDANLKVMLRSNKMYSYAELENADTFVTTDNFDIPASPPGQPLVANDRPDLFQVISFSDLLILATFIQEQNKLGIVSKERAFSFAIANAATISGFTDLFWFYMQAVNALPPGNTNTATQNSKVISMYNQLMPLTYNLLYTPIAESIQQEDNFVNDIQQIARANKFIGYSTCTSALRNLSENINLNGADQQNLELQIENYMAKIKSLVSSVQASAYNLSQDGQLASLTVSDNNAIAYVGANTTGNIFLLPGTKVNNLSLNN